MSDSHPDHIAAQQFARDTGSPTYLIAALEKEIAELRAAQSVPVASAAVPLRLDLGCGTLKREGFLGVDTLKFPGVDIVTDLVNKPWPWADGSVEEVNCSHMLEHVPKAKRVHFFNELYRVLKPGGKALFITPHWASERSYGDITHDWPVVPMFWNYLNKDWRAVNAPHVPFACDFDSMAMISASPDLAGRNQEYLNHAVKNFINAGFDMHCTLTRRG